MKFDTVPLKQSIASHYTLSKDIQGHEVTTHATPLRAHTGENKPHRALVRSTAALLWYSQTNITLLT